MRVELKVLISFQLASRHSPTFPHNRLEGPYQMATAGSPPSPRLLFFLLIFLLITTPSPSNSLPFAQFQLQILFSLSHSLMIRVANLRASRGDLAGSDRARFIARKLESGMGLGFRGAMLSAGSDYLRNYAWRDAASFDNLLEVASDVYELLRSLGQLSRTKSEAETLEWVLNALKVSMSLFERLPKVFRKSGPSRELVETVQKEVVEANLLPKDCLELVFWGAMWSVGGWDYVRNYAWGDAASFELLGAVSDMNEFLRSLKQFSRMESKAERMEWVSRNYRSALRVSRSLFLMFRQSGPLKEVVETVQKEVVEGDLLKDCLELGNNDLKGLIQIFRDISLQFFSSNPKS